MNTRQSSGARLRRSAFLGLSVVVATCLSACASVSTQRRAEESALERMRLELNAIPACCARLSDVTEWPDLPLKPKEFKIDDRTQVREFTHGKSRFIGFRLPERNERYDIELMPKPYFHSSRAEVGSHFAPSVLLLDKEFQPIGSEFEPPLKDDPGRYLWRDGPYADITIDPVAGARYMLVFANPQSFGSESHASGVLVAGYATVPVRYQRLAAPKGELMVGERKSER